MNAIRIEDSFGFGWSSTKLPFSLEMAKLVRLPYYVDDKITRYKDDEEWFFAYTSLEALQIYLKKSSDFEAMVKQGFKFYELTLCPNCIQVGASNHQLAFTYKGMLKKKDVTKKILKSFNIN